MHGWLLCAGWQAATLALYYSNHDSLQGHALQVCIAAVLVQAPNDFVFVISA
jgi:hypothetical protein